MGRQRRRLRIVAVGKEGRQRLGEDHAQNGQHPAGGPHHRDEAAGELGKVLLECGAETIEPAQLKQLIRASLTIGIGDALKRLSPA